MKILFKCPQCGDLYLTETWLQFTRKKTNAKDDEFIDYVCPHCHQSVPCKEFTSLSESSSTTGYFN